MSTWHLVKCFWRCFVSLFKFTYWSKFHVNIITDSGFRTIFFYKGLKRNPEIGNTPAWVLPNIWRLGRIRDTKFVTYVSNEMLLNTPKCQSYSFYGFWVIKGKPIGKGLKILPHQDRAKNANGWKCRRFYGCLCCLDILPWNCFQELWKMTSLKVSHFSPRILQKFCNFSLFKWVLSICTNFHNDWLKTWSDVGNLVFLLNEELYRKFAPVVKVCQRWRHK